MKRIILLLICLSTFFSFSLPAFSVGDSNIDSGGGGMGTGSSQHFWNSGFDGVRVTVVEANSGIKFASSVDYTNKNISSNVLHFGKISKNEYKSGKTLSLQVNNYLSKRPEQLLPVIVSDGDYNFSNIEQVRSYFTDEAIIRRIASDIGSGINYDKLISGDYKLMIEPIAYFTYNGLFFAMTATEAALYDNQVSGNLRANMAPLTHQNLPLAMFLEKNDLGFGAWTGSTTARAANSDIINYLGIGLVSFKEKEETAPGVITSDYTYRVNTDVITAITVSGGKHTPDNPVTVRFSINGTTYTVSNVIYPQGGSQLVWVKWRTPSTPRTMTINVTVTGGASASKGRITATIESLDENEPPDPTAYDKKPSGFSLVSTPSKTTRSSASWSVWRAYWVPVWRWCSHSEWGHWVDEGYWQFYTDNYSASITTSMSINPDQKAPTATAAGMKSGYGFTETARASISSNAPTADFTNFQNAVTYFPEFKYKTYWRLLKATKSGYATTFEFKQNKYSTYNSPVHFTPIWMPDGNYKVYTYILDCWTPAGMLSAEKTASLTIYESLWSDWHIAPA